MPRRRIFWNLFIGSTLALVALWWMSLRNSYDFIFSPRWSDFTLSGSFYHATLSLDLNLYDQYGSTFEVSTTPASDLIDSIRSLDGPYGTFGLGRFLTTGVGEAPGHYDYFLDMPLWLAYSLFVGSSFCILRFFGNHSSRSTEKLLALEQSVVLNSTQPARSSQE
jgi:hypothetical protein